MELKGKNAISKEGHCVRPKSCGHSGLQRTMPASYAFTGKILKKGGLDCQLKKLEEQE